MPYDTRNSTSSTSQSTPKTPTFPPPPPELSEKNTQESYEKKDQNSSLLVSKPKNSFQIQNIEDDLDDLENLNKNLPKTSGNSLSQPTVETKFTTADDSPTKKPSVSKKQNKIHSKFTIQNLGVLQFVQ